MKGRANFTRTIIYHNPFNEKSRGLKLVFSTVTAFAIKGLVTPHKIPTTIRTMKSVNISLYKLVVIKPNSMTHQF